MRRARSSCAPMPGVGEEALLGSLVQVAEHLELFLQAWWALALLSTASVVIMAPFNEVDLLSLQRVLPSVTGMAAQFCQQRGSSVRAWHCAFDIWKGCALRKHRRQALHSLCRWHARYGRGEVCFKDSRRLLPGSHLVEKQAQRRILRLSNHLQVGPAAPLHPQHARCSSSRVLRAEQAPCGSSAARCGSHLFKTTCVRPSPCRLAACWCGLHLLRLGPVGQCQSGGDIVVSCCGSGKRQALFHAFVQSKDAMERLLGLAAEVHARRTALHPAPAAHDVQVCCLHVHARAVRGQLSYVLQSAV